MPKETFVGKDTKKTKITTCSAIICFSKGFAKLEVLHRELKLPLSTYVYGSIYEK